MLVVGVVSAAVAASALLVEPFLPAGHVALYVALAAAWATAAALGIYISGGLLRRWPVSFWRVLAASAMAVGGAVGNYAIHTGDLAPTAAAAEIYAVTTGLYILVTDIARRLRRAARR